MESEPCALSAAFSLYLDTLKDQDAHWYGLDTGLPGEEYTICTLLGIPVKEYDSFLLFLGVVREKKDGKLMKNGNKTEEFCNALTLEHGFKWQRYRGHRKEKETAFICIGRFEEDVSFSAEDQEKEERTPPPINTESQKRFMSAWRKWNRTFNIVTPNRAIARHEQKEGVSRLAELYKRGAKKANDLPKKVSPDKDRLSDSPPPDMHNLTTVLNIISLNLFNKICDPDVFAALESSKLFSKGLSLDHVMDSLATTMVEVNNAKEEQQRKKSAAFHYATNPRVLSLDPSNYPFLTHKAIDVTCGEQVQCMLRDVIKMKQDEVDVLKFAQYNSKPTTLVPVPYSSNTTMFHKNLHRTKGDNFVDEILEAMLPPKIVLHDNEEMVGGGPKNDGRWTGSEHAAEALIVAISKKFPTAFVSAGDKIGMPVAKARKKMSAATTAAMLDDAAMTQNSLVVLRKYYINEYGWWFGASSQKRKELVADVVPPIVEVAKMGDNEINYWWKDMKEVILKKLKRITNRDGIVWNNLDIVLGGDHGQGSFRMSAKVILRQNRKKVKKFEVGLGDVECQTDSYSILKATLSEPINSSLKEIINYERDDDGKIKKDGSLKTIKKMGLDGTSFDMYYSFKDTPLEEDESLVVERPLRLFISGDLAFYAMMLGMKGSETNACWLCLLKKVSQWEEEPFKKGEERTMEWILSNYEEAEQKNERNNGLIEKPLFDAVDVSRYIVPPLHTMLGIANQILNDFKTFVENSVEDVPMELREARVFNTKGEVGWKEAKKALNDYDIINGPVLASLHQNIMDGSEHLEYLLEFDGMTEDVVETEQEIVEISLEIDHINEERRVLVEAINVALKIWTEAKSVLKSASFVKDTKKGKKRIIYLKPIKARIEKVLRKYGIDIAAYHGGDLVGNDCRKLMANAAMIFFDIGKVLDDVCIEQGMTDDGRRIVEERCRGVANALVVFDCIFSIVNKPNEDVDLEEDHKELSSLVKTALTCWVNLKDVNYRGKRNIPPKVHAVVQHLVDQFKEYGGIGDFDESFVELSHQTGKRDMLRSKAMRDRELKYSWISKWDETRTNPLVVAIKDEMAKRKRVFKDDAIRLLKKQKTSDERKARRKNLLDTMVMQDLASESGKLLAMKEYDERIEREIAATEARLEADNEAAGGEGAQEQEEVIGAFNV